MHEHKTDSESRRRFLQVSTAAAGGLIAGCDSPPNDTPIHIPTDLLPSGSTPQALRIDHFPDRLHAFVWRNWPLVPLERMALALRARRQYLERIGLSMGLGRQRCISQDQWRRSYITIIRRNWHILPYEQLLALLDWTQERLAFVLREDDFLYIKLGSLKPKCEPLMYSPPDACARARAGEIACLMRAHFPGGICAAEEPLFAFVNELSQPAPASRPKESKFSPRFCYSYFALYGDPLLEPETDPYPDGYLARLARAGVDGVWLQAVLHTLAPFPWDASMSARHDERLKNLATLVARARKHGIGIWLYLNEPRAQPLKFFANRPEKKGVVEGDHAALCTSDAEVQRFLSGAVEGICRAVPDLAGFFTITASENLTNCWSHGTGQNCPRCAKRPPGEVIAEVNGLFDKGIRQSGTKVRLLAWDWGWRDAWSGEIIQRLPLETALMSVSEWSLPIERGGIKSAVGEYSISAIGPGPRAQKHWELARKRGLKTIAKIQAGTTWELGSVPYIPAVENVARHAANLRDSKVDGLMLGWTLGGYPSPNLEVVAEICEGSTSPGDAIARVAERRFGARIAPHVVTAWREFSAAFGEFPFHIGLVYQSPTHAGPSNLLFEKPSGYKATMVGFPYDDLDAWRAVYPPEIFAAQLEKVAIGFDRALAQLRSAAANINCEMAERRQLAAEMSVAEAVSIHFQSAANQARFVLHRNALAKALPATEPVSTKAALKKLLNDEITLARRLHAIQSRDSRIGFEASNHYFYVPVDLAEKIVNCDYLSQRFGAPL